VQLQIITDYYRLLQIITDHYRLLHHAHVKYYTFFFRFGKTISVSMFAAAMLYSTPALELSIYSTCKRISQKLMRNVTKFLGLIYAELPNSPVMPTLRCNMEEVILQGPDGVQDIRIVNSYPSQVYFYFFIFLHTQHISPHSLATLPKEIQGIPSLLELFDQVRLHIHL
jgi:hypothetical protein